jgi:hypothetical protein
MYSTFNAINEQPKCARPKERTELGVERNRTRRREARQRELKVLKEDEPWRHLNHKQRLTNRCHARHA